MRHSLSQSVLSAALWAVLLVPGAVASADPATPVRAQYAWNDILVAPDERQRFDTFYPQLVLEFGSHGAHGH